MLKNGSGKQPIVGALLVDGANMAIRLDYGRGGDRIDFQAFERALASQIEKREKRPVVWSYRQMYRTFHPGSPTPRYQDFNKYLRHIGWTVDERPAKRMTDGHWRDKGSDLALALDAQALVFRKYISLIAVVTNDSDFAALYERMPADTKMYSVCWRKKMPEELTYIATPIYLEDIWNDIKMVPFSSAQSNDG